MSLSMLDLFSGFGGASAAMRSRGWDVIRVDNEPRCKPDIVADCCNLPIAERPFDLIWASPTCTYYSRYDKKCWFPDEPEPDHTLYQASREIIERFQPRFWVIENVRGAQRFWGKCSFHCGSQYFWSNLLLYPSFPAFERRLKHNLCSGTDPLRSAKRGYIPLPISEAFADLIEAVS